ncbi:hypothetical protein A9Q96_09965 [Rhodobacterales bacterium 52_120_T64]|nr:hypothetical protein A9Q96_09965 [Rhodobacterales bacterium 52_120_T64]
MDFPTLNKNLKNARAARNGLAVIVLLMIAANVMLSIKLVQTSNQVVLVPSKISDGMVARGAVDRRYMEALALDTVYAMYTVSPSTVEYGRTVIERVSSARRRAALLDQFDDNATDIRERRISTVFFVEKLEYNFANLQVVVVGRLGTYLETTKVNEEHRSILLTFEEEGSSVRLSKVERLEAE